MTLGESAVHILQEHYGLTAAVEPLPGDRDANFRVHLDDGSQRVLKLMHPDCTEATVDFQCAALAHLAQCPLNLPRVQATRNAQPWQRLTLPNGESRLVWLLSWCEGTLLADYPRREESLHHSFGHTLAVLDNALQGFEHPAQNPGHRWQLTAAATNRSGLPWVDSAVSAYVEELFDLFDNQLSQQLAALPHGVIHNDANDYNVLVDTSAASPQVKGIFDFGDMAYQPLVCDVAIALAYLVLDAEHPLEVMAQFLRGYHVQRPLSPAELAVVFPLVCLRLAVSVSISSERQQQEPDDPYIVISQQPAIRTLQRLRQIAPEFAHGWLREACGLPATDNLPALEAWLQFTPLNPAPIIDCDQYAHLIDLSIGSTLLGADPAQAALEPLTALIDQQMKAAGVQCGFGRYAEARGIYTAPTFAGGDYPSDERRTEHLGIDIFCCAGTAVSTPLAATVVAINDNRAPLDYGPVVILRHGGPQDTSFYSLYGHLNRDSVARLEIGQTLARGEAFARVGDASENGGWTPHLHLQVILDLLDLGTDFPGVCRASENSLWRRLSPNPALLLPTEDPDRFDARANPEQRHQRRKALLSGSLSLSYQQPLHIVRGYRQFLYDSSARAYLDVFNNVAHIGHSHPRVVSAVQRQMALLNTNTRYLHDNILNYADSLSSALPDPLSVCFFVNSASEANELALRLARNYTGRRDMLVLEAAYHGHTSTLVELSPYKYNGPGGAGPSDWVHEAPLADVYRGPFKADDPQAGEKYAAQLGDVITQMEQHGREAAGFIAETLPSVGGQIVFPPGYLAACYARVRAHGGLCIADEVQVGFGRLGDCFWGFEDQGVIPDIVVLGKPIANGFPLGAVVTTPEVAKAFDNGMEFFSTFGGNPVACAAGQAVLDTVQQEQLQQNALHRGNELLAGLKELVQRHEIAGDARGKGLFLGLELVRDRETLTPAAEEASYVVNRMREQQILMGTDGPHHNVLKIRPSMIVESADVDRVLSRLDRTLAELRC